MTRSAGILVVGSCMVDLVAFADRLPEAGETLVGTGFVQGFGGKGANQAVMSARFGLDVAMVAAVGADPNGAAIITNLREQGVAVRDVATVDASSGVAAIWVDGAGMNRIIIVPGANNHVEGAAAAATVTRARPVVVVGQLEIPQRATAQAFAAARSVGAVTVLNPAPGAALDADLLAVTDWLVPNETEFIAIGGRPLVGDQAVDGAAIRELAGRIRTGLIVTLGERGAALLPLEGQEVAWIPAPGAHAVDTTGAGDAFVGAFATGMALGWTFEDAVRLGCLAGSDSVGRVGTQASYASPNAARAMLASIRPT